MNCRQKDDGSASCVGPADAAGWQQVDGARVITKLDEAVVQTGAKQWSDVGKFLLDGMEARARADLGGSMGAAAVAGAGLALGRSIPSARLVRGTTAAVVTGVVLVASRRGEPAQGWLGVAGSAMAAQVALSWLETIAGRALPPGWNVLVAAGIAFAANVAWQMMAEGKSFGDLNWRSAAVAGISGGVGAVVPGLVNWSTGGRVLSRAESLAVNLWHAGTAAGGAAAALGVGQKPTP